MTHHQLIPNFQLEVAMHAMGERLRNEYQGTGVALCPYSMGTTEAASWLWGYHRFAILPGNN